jgi:NAD(P)-dependent dehydrogenase (short-subunit alcohol dehydrogenase family)
MQSSDKLPTYPDLAGKVAVVTGGSGGIGAATCRVLAANGARVAVNGRDPARIDAVVGAIRAAGGESVGVAADCTDLAAVEAMRRRVEQHLGPADIVAAKAGVVMLTRQVAAEVGRHGVRVNCLAPHTILTEQVERAAPEEWRQRMAAAIPLGRLGTPEDVALAAVFLASDSAAFLTGVTLDVAGGYVMA